MLVGYEASLALRSNSRTGAFSRELIAGLARAHVQEFRALLFSTHIKREYRGHYSGDPNVSTYLPVGASRLLPEVWLRYRLNPWLKEEKVRILHGLGDELPYHIGRGIKTVVTCHGKEHHLCQSLPDRLMWRSRMRYSFSAADVVVAVSEEVKQELLAAGVAERKIKVIGHPGDPWLVSPEVVEAYYRLYSTLLGE